MTKAGKMPRTHSADLGQVDRKALAAAIEECFASTQVSTACADACLREQTIAELVQCVGTSLDSADISDATGRVLLRHTGHNGHLTRATLEACITACKACGDDCEQHTGTEHCRSCGETSRRCERACGELMTSLS